MHIQSPKPSDIPTSPLPPPTPPPHIPNPPPNPPNLPLPLPLQPLQLPLPPPLRLHQKFITRTHLPQSQSRLPDRLSQFADARVVGLADFLFAVPGLAEGAGVAGEGEGDGVGCGGVSAGEG